MKPITLEQALTYEAAQLPLLKEIWYRRFTRSFIAMVEKKYHRYLTFINKKNDLQSNMHNHKRS